MNEEVTIEQFNRIKNISMVFIMGKERSGTTLLQTFLDGHPNIIAPPESEFIVLLYPRFGKIKKWSEKNIYDFIEELYKELWITKTWRIDRKLLTAMLLSIKDEADYASICKVIYYSMRKDKGNILWISDKNPIYVLFTNTLLKIFPEAKFIHLVRDPRDNVNSHIKSFGGGDIGFVSQKWLAYNSILIKNKQTMPERYHTLLYEKMVDDPQKNMQDLCEFLRVSYNDKMVQNTFPEFLKTFSDQQLILEKAKQIHYNLLQPVNTSNIGKWKKSMSPEDISLIEKITGGVATKNFSYVMEGNFDPTALRLNFRVLKSKVIYCCWQVFTRMRYKSYRINTGYVKVNLYFGREIRIFGNALRNS